MTHMVVPDGGTPIQTPTFSFDDVMRQTDIGASSVDDDALPRVGRAQRGDGKLR